MEPTECNSKKGLAFDFKDPDDLDALALGMSWWQVQILKLGRKFYFVELCKYSALHYEIALESSGTCSDEIPRFVISR